MFRPMITKIALEFKVNIILKNKISDNYRIYIKNLFRIKIIK